METANLGDDRKSEAIIKILIGGVKEEREKRMRQPRNPDAPFICMVPSVLRGVNPKSFGPRLVSIGPLHHGNKNLVAFEAHKVTYMYDLFLRSPATPAEETLNACVQKVDKSMDRIMACYPKLKSSITYVPLAKMMVIDSCFILEFLQKLSSLKPKWSILFIALDLMLLENQIPYFVLTDIFECTILKSDPEASLTNMLSKVLKLINPFHGKLNTDGVGTTHDHILGLFHRCFRTSNFSKPEKFSKLPRVKSVVELNRAGVDFRPHLDQDGKPNEGRIPNEDGGPDEDGKTNQGKTCTMAMKYESSSSRCFYWPWCRPALRMPKLHIEDHTELVLRNFIAYEQYFDKVPYYFTSYATAMDVLVDAQEDIAMLVGCGVIVNDLGSDEDAAKMINKLCKDVCNEEFFYEDVWKGLSKYYMDYWPEHVATMRRRYFSSPWNAIALFAGIVLFVLTVLETIFTVRGK